MAKRSKPLKLPPDFLANVKAFLNTPPPPKAKAKTGRKKQAKAAIK
jgi:hypothetical protein